MEKTSIGLSFCFTTSHALFWHTNTMFATRRLLQSCRITFFTRETCGLCKQAKGVLSDVWDKRPFAYTEVNVDAPQPESKAWRALYDYDVPVVCWNYSLRR